VKTSIPALATAVWLAAGLAPAFETLVVIGDSLSDVGNVAPWMLGESDYDRDRWNNPGGKVWVEHLAEAMPGVPVPTSLFSGGPHATNYARAGSSAQPHSILFEPFSVVLPVGIEQQVAQYGEDVGGLVPDADTTLFIVWAGGNDLLSYDLDPAGAAAAVGANVQSLADMGAVHFFVPNLPDMSRVPAHGSLAETLTFNDTLAADLGDLSTLRPELDIIPFDVFTEFGRIVTSPPSPVTNPADAYLDIGGVVEEFLFFDELHPTDTGHRLIAQHAVAAVPEPASLVLLATAGLSLLFAVHRRRR